MSEVTLLLLRIGFLLVLWFFVFAVVYSLRADLFGVRARKLPETGEGATPRAHVPPGVPVAPPQLAGFAAAAAVASVTGGAAPAQPPSPGGGNGESFGGKATTSTVSRIVITTGPKSGLELPLGTDPLTIGRSSEAGLVIRDDYTSSHHARLVLWGEQWMVQDLDSTNGTWLGGKRIASPVPVSIGEPIKVGATTFELRK